MTRRFVVGIDDETSQDVSLILDYIREQGCSWWHWFDNFWLLTTHNDEISAGTIRDELVEICGDKNLIVLEVNDITWATYGPQGEGSDSSKNISRWFKEAWSN